MIGDHEMDLIERLIEAETELAERRLKEEQLRSLIWKTQLEDARFRVKYQEEPTLDGIKVSINDVQNIFNIGDNLAAVKICCEKEAVHDAD